MVKLPPLEDDTMPGPPKKRGKKKYGIMSTYTFTFSGKSRSFTWTRWYGTEAAQNDALKAADKNPDITAVKKVLR